MKKVAFATSATKFYHNLVYHNYIMSIIILTNTVNNNKYPYILHSLRMHGGWLNSSLRK